MRKVAGEENPADIGTKALDGERLWALMSLLGFRPSRGLAKGLQMLLVFNLSQGAAANATIYHDEENLHPCVHHDLRTKDLLVADDDECSGYV